MKIIKNLISCLFSVKQQSILCSLCFSDPGLRLDAMHIGISNDQICESCGSANGKKLTARASMALASRFFVLGTTLKQDYGAAPIVQFNEMRETEISVPDLLLDDVQLLSKILNIGFFHYGPRLWMIGEVEPLKDLLEASSRPQIISRILQEYPKMSLAQGTEFYRVRISPKMPENHLEYDSPPVEFSGSGRLDSSNLSVLYGSQDLQICLHECRVSADDEVYFATLSLNRRLNILDLTAILDEETTEFESLDMAVFMLFLAGKHSHEICKAIAMEAYKTGYDGIAFPSYFSMLRTGSIPFENSYGLSHRRFSEAKEYERNKIVPNIGLFGHPIKSKKLTIVGINRVQLRQVHYDLSYGPVGIH